MPQPTSIPAQIVADTIVRTIELGVRITDAAVDGETTVPQCSSSTSTATAHASTLSLRCSSWLGNYPIVLSRR
jgi:hypothetical protein